MAFPADHSRVSAVIHLAATLSNRAAKGFTMTDATSADRSSLILGVEEPDRPGFMAMSADPNDSDGTDGGAKGDNDGTDGGDSDGTDGGGDADGTDGSDGDGTDGGAKSDGDGTDGTDGDGTDGGTGGVAH